MAENYRVRVRRGDFEVEVESTDKAYVETKIEQYLRQTPEMPPGSAPQRASSAKTEGRPLSAGEFVRQINPDKKNEVAATLAYFLEYHSSQEEWKPDDVATKFTDVRKSKPANMTDLLAKSNFFMKGREFGFYRLSESGVRWVEERLTNAR